MAVSGDKAADRGAGPDEAEGGLAAKPTAWLRVLGEIFYRHWGAKIAAFILAAILFVVTRDEVTRTFEVPLRVQRDPDRVLLTEVPDTVQVQVRGPWTRLNRLQDYDLGSVTLDLDNAQPGPLQIDPAAIVMPAGVVLADVVYDSVDLRFDPVIERPVGIRAPLQGSPADDYELVRVEVQPLRWQIRGGESQVQQVDKLVTEPLDIDGATDDVTMKLTVSPPREGVTLVDAGSRAVVTVRAIINPKHETRPYAVPVIVPEDLDPTGAVPRTYQVTIEGPLPDFRVLERLSVTFPVEAKARLAERREDNSGVVEVEFTWASAVPDDVRRRLAYDHAVERISLPPPPPPPPPPEPLDGLEEEPA